MANDADFSKRHEGEHAIQRITGVTQSGGSSHETLLLALRRSHDTTRRFSGIAPETPRCEKVGMFAHACGVCDAGRRADAPRWRQNAGIPAQRLAIEHGAKLKRGDSLGCAGVRGLSLENVCGLLAKTIRNGSSKKAGVIGHASPHRCNPQWCNQRNQKLSVK